MFDGLRGGQQARVMRRAALEFLHDLLAFRDDALDRVAGLALGALAEDLEDLLQALDLGGDFAFDLVRQARESGLLINAPRPNLLRLMPALTVTPDEIDELLSRLDPLLAERRVG